MHRRRAGNRGDHRSVVEVHRLWTTMLRTIIGVIVGWVVFGVSALVFPLTGHDPHGPATPGFMAIAIVLGVVAAFVGGWVAVLVARRRRAALGLAVVIAVIAAVSLVANRAGGSF